MACIFWKIGASRVSSGVSNGVSNGPGSPLVLRQAKKPLPLVLGFPLLCFTCQAAAKGVDDWAKNPIIQPPSPLALMSSSSLQVASVDSILGADCIFMVMISLLSFTQNQVPTWFTQTQRPRFFFRLFGFDSEFLTTDDRLTSPKMIQSTIFGNCLSPQGLAFWSSPVPKMPPIQLCEYKIPAALHHGVLVYFALSMLPWFETWFETWMYHDLTIFNHI